MPTTQQFDPFSGWTEQEKRAWTELYYQKGYDNNEIYGYNTVNAWGPVLPNFLGNYAESMHIPFGVLCPPKTTWNTGTLLAETPFTCAKIKVGPNGERWFEDENSYLEYNNKQCPPEFYWNEEYKSCWARRPTVAPAAPSSIPQSVVPSDAYYPTAESPLVNDPPRQVQPPRPSPYKNRNDLLKKHVRAECDKNKPAPIVVDNVAAGTVLRRYCCDIPDWPGLGDLYEELADGRGGSITKLVQKESPFCQNPPPPPPPSPPRKQPPARKPPEIEGQPPAIYPSPVSAPPSVITCPPGKYWNPFIGICMDIVQQSLPSPSPSIPIPPTTYPSPPVQPPYRDWETDRKSVV